MALEIKTLQSRDGIDLGRRVGEGCHVGRLATQIARVEQVGLILRESTYLQDLTLLDWEIPHKQDISIGSAVCPVEVFFSPIQE